MMTELKLTAGGVCLNNLDMGVFKDGDVRKAIKEIFANMELPFTYRYHQILSFIKEKKPKEIILSKDLEKNKIKEEIQEVYVETVFKKSVEMAITKWFLPYNFKQIVLEVINYQEDLLVDLIFGEEMIDAFVRCMNTSSQSNIVSNIILCEMEDLLRKNFL